MVGSIMVPKKAWSGLAVVVVVDDILRENPILIYQKRGSD